MTTTHAKRQSISDRFVAALNHWLALTEARAARKQIATAKQRMIELAEPHFQLCQRQMEAMQR